MNHLSPSAPIWGKHFDLLFLFAAAFGALALAIWGAGFVAMLYGAAVAGIPHFGPMSGTFSWPRDAVRFCRSRGGGLLLTAVQNWTGRRATNGKPLLILAMVWLAARADAFGRPRTLVVDRRRGYDFYADGGVVFFSLLFQVRQTHNYFFAVVMLIAAPP